MREALLQKIQKLKEGMEVSEETEGKSKCEMSGGSMTERELKVEKLMKKVDNLKKGVVRVNLMKRDLLKKLVDLKNLNEEEEVFLYSRETIQRCIC